ncbi:MAG: endonuclease/exonuclease/phosphatase family protein [Bryobacterales bacterium]
MALRTAVLAIAFAVILPAQSLRVMTFNVRYPNPEDGANIWENRRELLVDTIRRSDPDVFGTQEMFYSQGAFIAEQLPQYEWFGVSRRGNHEDEHMGVFYKRGKLFPLESGNFWLSETPSVAGSMSWDVSLPRMVTWARFREASGREFWLYNTHFPHRQEDAAARFECAKVIAADIAKRVPADADLILIGDFNSSADSDVHELLTKKLEDSRATAKQKLGLETTSSRWVGAKEGRRIDWVLYRAGLQPLVNETVEFHRSASYPSDHYPVFVEFLRD